MRIQLEFIVQKNELPIEYRRVFLSYIKFCLSNFNEGKELENYYGPAKEKEYSFAIFFEKPEFLKTKVTFKSNKVRMIFSTADKMTWYIIYAMFLENKHKKFPLPENNEMTLVDIQKRNDIKITGNEVLFRTLSPLCIRKHEKDTGSDYYYSYIHKDFKDEFNKVVKNQLGKHGFTPMEIESLDIKPLWCKKVIIKHYDNKIECTIGKILLKGTSDILQYLMDAGVGSRKSAGFGLLELIVQE